VLLGVKQRKHGLSMCRMIFERIVYITFHNAIGLKLLGSLARAHLGERVRNVAFEVRGNIESSL